MKILFVLIHKAGVDLSSKGKHLLLIYILRIFLLLKSILIVSFLLINISMETLRIPKNLEDIMLVETAIQYIPDFLKGIFPDQIKNKIS